MRRPIWLPCLIGFLSLSCCAPKAALKKPDQVLSELTPYYRIFKPDGPPPYPTVLFLHGAFDDPWNGLTRECYKPMIDRFVENGYAAIFIDSFTARGVTHKGIRSGQMMPPERAGDLYVTMAWAREQSWVDKDRMAAVGFSHGGGTIMDALVLAPPKKPTGLEAVPADGLNGLRGAVLYYPYCTAPVLGVRVTYAYDEDWSVPIPVLAFIPALDRQLDARVCRRILDRHQEKGLPVEYVWYPGADHNFDGEYGSQRSDRIGPYQPEAARDSVEEMFRFLSHVMQ